MDRIVSCWTHSLKLDQIETRISAIIFRIPSQDTNHLEPTSSEKVGEMARPSSTYTPRILSNK